jgi:asparagine synthase (glutamine-hydrolysing)
MPSWKREMQAITKRLGRDQRPPKDSFALRVRLMQRQDSGQARKSMLAGYGVDERDPTNDRRLIEFCLSLPTEALLKDGIRRPVARTALADRLPPEVLGASLRGLQTADWYEQITKREVSKFFDTLSGSAAAGRVIDLEALGALIESWPDAGWHKRSVDHDYGTAGLQALSAAHFARTAS